MNERGYGCTELIVRPEGPAWSGLLRRTTSRRIATFRRELRLPTDRPLIMTGHQAEFWHPGILAKYLAADAAARQFDADVAWITVDQDAQPVVGVRYPARDGEGHLAVRTVEYTAVGGTRMGAAHDTVAPFVADGLKRIDDCMAKHHDEPVLARRVAAAVRELISPLLSHPRPAASITATDLAKTSLFGELVERMARDPERLCEAYNAAAARHPSAGIRPLIANEIQEIYELPLWHIPEPGTRHRVYAEMLDKIPREELAPRALLMTGLLRLAGCDLFVHGTGGGGAAEDDAGREGYDRITEEWLIEWLGLASGDLAPITVVTATCRLPLEPHDPPSPVAVARAVWVAHHARHDPAMLNDTAAAAEKRHMVSTIAAAEKPERADHFDRMQALLGDYREQHREELITLHQQAERRRQQRAEAAIVLDRTWPFALYPAEVLQELRSKIELAFAASLNPGGVQ